MVKKELNSPQKAGPPSEQVSNPLVTGRALILLQLVSRLLTFALNQALVRLASPEVFGTAAIQFDLISSTILFLSRQGVRTALIRAPEQTQQGAQEEAKQEQQSRALATVPLYLGLIVSAAVTGIYLYGSTPSTTSQSSFHLSLGLYVVSALLELLIEPLYIRTVRGTNPKLRIRVQAEGGMAVTKAIATFVFLLKLPHQPLLGFAVGQLVGAVCLAGRYILEYGTGGLLWITPLKSTPRFDSVQTRLAVVNTRQSFIKHLLTEADRIAVGRISPLKEQGGYAIAMNYGSLVARIFFQPLEETLFLHVASHPPSTSPSVGPLLTFILHVCSYLFLFLPAFLPPLLPPILPFLLPRRYLMTSAPFTLKRYLEWYVPMMSINGILEAFHSATATSSEVSKQATWMIASSFSFAGSLYLLTQNNIMPTEQCLIAASCAGMLVRAIYAFWHARTKVTIPIRQMLPKSSVTISTMLSGTLLRRVYYSGRWMQGPAMWLELVGLGVVTGLCTFIVLVLSERSAFAEIQKAIGNKGKVE